MSNQINAQLLDFAKWVLSLNTGGLIEGRARAAIASAEAMNESSPPQTFEEWFLGEQGKPYGLMYVFAKAAWAAASKNVPPLAFRHSIGWDAGGGDYAVSVEQQPPSVPVAYLHEIVEPDGQVGKMYSTSAKNPWSNWMESHQNKCKHTCTPLYAQQPPAVPDGYALDAARYRWILHQAWFQEACDRFDFVDGGLQNRFERCVDEMIDRAMPTAAKEQP